LGRIEAGLAIVHGRIIENARIPSPRDEYYETVIIPGFSDAHMHPQVVDGGLNPRRLWRDSYEWISGRRLRVDEAALRADLNLSARLAKAVYELSLLEGVTLVAVTGNAEANIRAWLSMDTAPRAVFLPTVMKKPGWPTVRVAEGILRRLRGLLDDGLTRIGVFVHSIRLAGEDQLVEAVGRAKLLGGVVGLHLGEGVPEAEIYWKVTKGSSLGVRVVAVHCISDSDPSRYGLLCASCPATNLILYGYTRSSLRGVTSFGSDWPLLLGTVARHIPLIYRAFGGFIEGILRRLTVGGYKDYGISYSGDLVAFDAKLEKLLSNFTPPKLVMVAGRPAVVEGVLRNSGLTQRDLERKIRRLIKEAIEKYGASDAPKGDPIQEAREALESLIIRQGSPARSRVGYLFRGGYGV